MGRREALGEAVVSTVYYPYILAHIKYWQIQIARSKRLHARVEEEAAGDGYILTETQRRIIGATRRSEEEIGSTTDGVANSTGGRPTGSISVDLYELEVVREQVEYLYKEFTAFGETVRENLVQSWRAVLFGSEGEIDGAAHDEDIL